MMAKSKEAKKSEVNKKFATKNKQKKVLKCEICDYSFAQTGSLKMHVMSVHRNKKPFKYEIYEYSCSKNLIWKIMLSQFMGIKSHSNVIYLTTAAPINQF